MHIFQLFDTEQKGTVSLLELKSVLEQVAQEGNGNDDDNDDDDDDDYAFKQRRRRQALEKVLASPAFANACGDRQLTQQEFVQLLTEVEQAEGNDDMRRIFELFDTDQKGYIDVEDLKRIAQDLGEDSMGQEDLQEMIDRAATTEQGRVNMEELEAVLKHKLMA